ncbi:radical SAM protein [Terasakiella sp. SH-1]|uniref:B12-binding domain-containing radical SAM protein n=1 Tax=Terasakiella sp. SH-1 TaxID=2560057 RepID=UPI0014316850|nr:radical SAM protein [Terasakiella sp. SH-1]
MALSAYVKVYTDAEVKCVDFCTVLNRAETFDYPDFETFFDQYLASPEITDFAPTIIGISALFTTTYENMIMIVKSCRALFPNAIILGGGAVPTNMYREIFSHTDCFDALLHGEGERPLVELIKAEDKQVAINGNSCWITPEKVAEKQSFTFDFIEELDEIPTYDYDVIDLADYRLNPTISAYPGADSSKQNVTYMTSRGCPFRCVFCSAHSLHGRKMRFYSLERMRQDFTLLKEKYGTELIIFQDDHFMADTDRAHEVLALLKELGLSAFFPNSLTLYALDRPMLEALKAVNVKILILAVESGSGRVLKEVMKKPLKLPIINRVVDDCHDLGIDTDVNIIIGLPGETKKDMQDARDFLKTLHATWFRVYTAVPLVGSEMYENCIENGYIEDGFIDGDFKNAVIETEDFTSEYVQRMAYTMNIELNFVHNGEMKRGNYGRALMDFKNTIRVKDDHAFAYYYAAQCFEKLGDEEQSVVYKKQYNQIMQGSEFWQEYAAEFNVPASVSL